MSAHPLAPRGVDQEMIPSPEIRKVSRTLALWHTWCHSVFGRFQKATLTPESMPDFSSHTGPEGG